MAVNLGSLQGNTDAHLQQHSDRNSLAIMQIKTLQNAGVGPCRTAFVSGVAANAGVVRLDTGAKAQANNLGYGSTTYDDGPLGVSIGAGIVAVSGDCHIPAPVIDPASSSPAKLIPYTTYYLSGAVAGAVTEVPPIPIGPGITGKSHSLFNRAIFFHQAGNVVSLIGPVAADNVPPLEMLPDVKISATPANSDFLSWNSVDSLWENVNSLSWLNGSDKVTMDGTQLEFQSVTGSPKATLNASQIVFDDGSGNTSTLAPFSLVMNQVVGGSTYGISVIADNGISVSRTGFATATMAAGGFSVGSSIGATLSFKDQAGATHSVVGGLIVS